MNDETREGNVNNIRLVGPELEERIGRKIAGAAGAVLVRAVADDLGISLEEALRVVKKLQSEGRPIVLEGEGLEVKAELVIGMKRKLEN